MFADDAGVGGAGEEFGGGSLPGRMLERRRDFGKGDQNKVALQHAWVWNLQFRGGDDFVAVEKDVQIDKAGTFGEGFLAAHAGFDFAEGVKQIDCRQICFRGNDGVEKPGLLEKINGFGFVDAGKFREMCRRFIDETESGAQVFRTVPDIASQC